MRQLMRGMGSYVLSTRDDRKESITLDLGTATNNEAMSRTLGAAVGDLFSRIQRASNASPRYALPVQTDSQIVLGSLTQGGRSSLPMCQRNHLRADRSTLLQRRGADGRITQNRSDTKEPGHAPAP